jgi:ADP-ribose pyrophosphatase YjhB (NUDIX family)
MKGAKIIMGVVNADGLTEAEFLARYKPSDYERPSVTSDLLIFGMTHKLDGLKVLLIKRKDHPYINHWALAGGFVGIDESCYQAANRELEEETGLRNIYLEQLYTMSNPSRDPRMRVISVAYMALIPVVDVKAGDDAKEALWFDVKLSDKFLTFINNDNNIIIKYKLQQKTFKNGIVKVKGNVPISDSEEKLAFDHAEVVLTGLERLRGKLEYSDIAFNLVPEEFTLSDLQRVYEIILDTKLYKSNFKAKLAGKIEPLNKSAKSITGNKKAELYKYRG